VANAYDVVRAFECAIAEYTGAPYAVSTESCSSAILLCCMLEKVSTIEEVLVPKRTYPSVPSSIVLAGGRVKFMDIEWQHTGMYQLCPTDIIDSAKCLIPDMYIPGTLTCLSFHGKKGLKIGRGGMILTDSVDKRDWLKCARFDGRHECALIEDRLAGIGLNCYMSPEQAARGLELFQWYKGAILPPDEYPDLSQYGFYHA